MLVRRKPNLSKGEWFPVLEAMHFELFICEREGTDPPPEIQARRRERVLAIMNDPRLEGCFWWSEGVEAMATLPYPVLRKHAMQMRRVIQDQWLWGRNWEKVMACTHKSPRWKTYGGKGSSGQSHLQQSKIEGLVQMCDRLRNFLSYGEDPVPTEQWKVLRTEVERIVKNRRFRNCYWYRTGALLGNELYFIAWKAKGTIEIFLGEEKPKKKKVVRRKSSAGKTKVSKPQDLWPFPAQVE